MGKAAVPAIMMAGSAAINSMGKDSAQQQTSTSRVNPWSPAAPYMSAAIPDLAQIYLRNQAGGGGFGGPGNTMVPGAGNYVPGNSATAGLVRQAQAPAPPPQFIMQPVTGSISPNSVGTGYTGNASNLMTQVLNPKYADWLQQQAFQNSGGGGGGGAGGAGFGMGGPSGMGGYDPFGAGSPWNTANNEYMKVLTGQYANNIQGNPYIENVINKAMGDVGAQFEGAGRYGSGVNQSALMNAAGNLRYQDYAQRYAQERQAQLAAMGNAPAWAMTPYQLNQAQIAAPYQNIKEYLGQLSPLGFGAPTTGVSNPYYTNPLGQALGAASTGVGLYNQMGGLGGGGGIGYQGSAVGPAAYNAGSLSAGMGSGGMYPAASYAPTAAEIGMGAVGGMSEAELLAGGMSAL